MSTLVTLDVERLFTALCNVTGMCWDGEAIAAEYDRLTRSSADPTLADCPDRDGCLERMEAER